MKAFVDTSAFYAALDRNDDFHDRASIVWRSLAEEPSELVTTNYVLVETNALVQRRLGLDALRTFSSTWLPLMSVEWLEATQHEAALEAVLAANRTNLSLVDCSSFACMRRRNIEIAFTYDRHFREQGFRTL